MKYFEKAPSIAVSRFIKCYWVLEDDSPTNFVQTIVPDGRFELILNLRRPFQSLQSEQWYSQPDCFFVGQITGPLLVRANGPATVIGVRFQVRRPASAGSANGPDQDVLCTLYFVLCFL